MNLPISKKQLWAGLSGVLLFLLLYVAMRPDPIAVKAVKVASGPFQVTLREEGTTTVYECFRVAAPITGTLHRIDLKEGIRLRKGQMVASMSPPPLDPRQQSELSERINGAGQTLAAAKAQVEEVRKSLTLEKQNLGRYQNLLSSRAISQEKFDQQQTRVEVLEKQLQSSELRASAASYELGALKAALKSNRQQKLALKAPVSGTLLRLHEKSERVVPAGTPIATIGDKENMDIVIDVLSSDAVKVETGQKVLIENWGGKNPLTAYVERIEPAAYTKISALGIEEKRVNIIAKLEQPEPRLGDNFRIEARIILWEGQEVLQVPQNALFRSNTGWAVYKVEGSEAKKVGITPGKRSRFNVEVVEGLSEGDLVISHPPNNLEDGSTIEMEMK